MYVGVLSFLSRLHAMAAFMFIPCHNDLINDARKRQGLYRSILLTELYIGSDTSTFTVHATAPSTYMKM